MRARVASLIIAVVLASAGLVTPLSSHSVSADKGGLPNLGKSCEKVSTNALANSRAHGSCRFIED
jgi:hypothetical protein